MEPDYMRKKKQAEKAVGRPLSKEEFESEFLENGGGGRMSDTGTSIFDPVLCETQYLWFTNPGDRIIDPFAGGSVRGIVAVELGRDYFGVDLRQEQIEANVENAKICTNNKPEWVCGDSINIKRMVGEQEYDFLFTCPPYGDLEVYSNNPNDLSNMSDGQFDEKYSQILEISANTLKNNRFASIVVGNYRDKNGYLRDLVGLTVRAMEKAGCKYYNDSVFVTPIGSLPIRAGRAFLASRKIGRTHQYILNFCKGDPKKATDRLDEIEIPDMSEYIDEE